jgi:hypothetical protein
MNNSTAMSADPIPPSTTHLAKAKLSFRLKGTDIAIKKGGQGCRISFNQTGTLYYGVIVESVSSQKFAVAPPDDVWTQISGESVNRGWYDHEGLCTVRRETIVDVIDDSNMMQIKINDPYPEDMDDDDDDDMNIEAPNDETKTPNDAESSSISDGAPPSDDDDDDDDNDDNDESAVGVPPVQSTFQTNNASPPPPTMSKRRKSNRKPKNKAFFDEDNYHKGR